MTQIPGIIKSAQFQLQLQPLGYALLVFVIGIVLEYLFNLPQTTLILILVGLWLGIICSYYFKLSAVKLTGGLGLAFMLLGALLFKVEQTSQATAMRHIDEIFTSDLATEPPFELYGQLIAMPTILADRAYLDVETTMVTVHGRTTSLIARMRLTIWLSDQSDRKLFNNLNLSSGTAIYAQAQPRPFQYFKNPGQVDGRNLLLQQGFVLAATIKSPLLIEVLTKVSSSIGIEATDKVRKYLLNQIDSQFTTRVGGVLKATILGDAHYLDADIVDRFQAGGSYHILVISGSHFILITLTLNTLLGLLTRRPWLKFLVISLSLWSYGWLLALPIPVFRALIMINLALLARALYRQVAPGNTLGVAGLILLASQPSALFEVSFQYSFLATTLILLLVLPLITRLAEIGRWQPSISTPYPPNCGRWLRSLAEILFWREQQFQQKIAQAVIKYRLEKSPWAERLAQLYLQRLVRGIFITLFTATLVQLGMLPITAYYFHRATILGAFLDGWIEICLSLILISFGLLLLVTWLCPSISYLVVIVVDKVTTLFIASAWPDLEGTLTPYLKLLSPRVAQTHSSIYYLYFIPLIALIVLVNYWQPLSKPLTLVQQKRQVTCCRIFGLIVTLSYLACLLPILKPYWFKCATTDRLAVTFLDVGQGDAAFLQFPHGTTMMIDSGGLGWQKDQKERFSIGNDVDAPYLWSHGIYHIDYLVVTHSHKDHIEGFSAILANFSVGQVVVPVMPSQDPEFERFKHECQLAHVPIVVWSQGEHKQLENVAIEVLWPALTPVPARLDNDQSLVLRFTYGQRRLLFTGDIEVASENSLVARRQNFQADVLKVPHHGSHTSSTINFIQQVDPRIAIISAPLRSRFNHPHAEVVTRYNQLGICLYQTGALGAITITTNGQDLLLKSY